MVFSQYVEFAVSMRTLDAADMGQADVSMSITLNIDEAIQLAKDLECCPNHHRDHDKPGQFFACHAERQLLMEWLEYMQVEYMQGEGKVFSCDTSIDVCDDCKQFFNMAAGYLNIEVWINGTRYGYT